MAAKVKRALNINESKQWEASMSAKGDVLILLTEWDIKTFICSFKKVKEKVSLLQHSNSTFLPTMGFMGST